MIAAGFLIYVARSLFLSFILAVFLTYLLGPLVDAMEKKGMTRTGAILLSYLCIFFVACSVFLYGVPRLVDQMNVLVQTLPSYTVQFEEIVVLIQEKLNVLGLPAADGQVLEDRVRWLQDIIFQVAEKLLSGFWGFLNYLFKIVLAPVFSFYLLKDLGRVRPKVYSILPSQWRGGALELWHEIDKVLGSFFRGYLTVAVIVGGLVAVVLAVLGMDFALMLGLLAGLAELIPYFGPLIGAVPAVALALLKSSWMAVKVGIAFIVIHQLEGMIISPKILGNRVGIHPLLVILSVMLGGELYGLPGIILSVPLAAVIKVIVLFAYKKVVSP